MSSMFSLTGDLLDGVRFVSLSGSKSAEAERSCCNKVTIRNYILGIDTFIIVELRIHIRMKKVVCNVLTETT
jgi:hypothetical protein